MISLSAYKSCLAIYKLIEESLEPWGYGYYFCPIEEYTYNVLTVTSVKVIKINILKI